MSNEPEIDKDGRKVVNTNSIYGVAGRLADRVRSREAGFVLLGMSPVTALIVMAPSLSNAAQIVGLGVAGGVPVVAISALVYDRSVYKREGWIR